MKVKILDGVIDGLHRIHVIPPRCAASSVIVSSDSCTTIHSVRTSMLCIFDSLIYLAKLALRGAKNSECEGECRESANNFFRKF